MDKITSMFLLKQSFKQICMIFEQICTQIEKLLQVLFFGNFLVIPLNIYFRLMFGNKSEYHIFEIFFAYFMRESTEY